MPVERFTDGLEPADHDASIWRFMRFEFFADLIKTSQLYFARADRFDDSQEGLPPAEYIHALGLSPYDLNDIHARDARIGSIACWRRDMYLCCWYLFQQETASMWTQFAPDGGVAICSRYSLLRAVLEPLPYRPHLGLVRYGAGQLTNWNTIRFISTKRKRFEHEREVRAMLWITPWEGESNNRHYDINNVPHQEPVYGTLNPCGYRPAVDLSTLLTRVVVSPYAPPERLDEVKNLLKDHAHSCPVDPSLLKSETIILPTLEDLKQFGLVVQPDQRKHSDQCDKIPPSQDLGL
jgi:hypothetical protein